MGYGEESLFEGKEAYVWAITSPLLDNNGNVVGAKLSDVFKEADNKMYREKLHRSQSACSAIVQILMKALEARDYITEGHADRLQNLVVDLAMAIELPEHRITSSWLKK